ncbi:MAG TPA: IS1380 family transposase, partial [Steroidobacteraceae bacterium]|nr:IS1380 family transposase [Steroidobacteraceae bacterium]
MGEDLTSFRAEFNGSVRIEAREERLTTEGGAIVLREVLERLGIVGWLAGRLRDPRDPRLVTHSMPELLRTAVLLIAQGWRDRDDADALRDDAALRLAVSDRRGISPLLAPARDADEPRPKNPVVPDGLASQPTLSRLTRALSTEENRSALRCGVLEASARRIRAARGGHRMRYATIDVDGLPVEVHGHQPGSEYNGHYHARIYHPIVASLAETGDLLDIRLRPGNVHGAEGALEFVTSLVERVEERLCQVASVRMDAGFPEEKLLAALEKRRTPYVARVRNNSVLDAMAEPLLRRPPGRPPNEPRTWIYERSYQAGSWSRPRRVVLVVLERPGELFLHHFWLITSWSEEQMDGDDLLELYRERGTAEGHFGELMSVIEPALSSSPRPKTHYRGEVPAVRTAPGDAFAQNEALLLLNALAYNVAHAARVLLEGATGEGWSLRRL